MSGTPDFDRLNSDSQQIPATQAAPPRRRFLRAATLAPLVIFGALVALFAAGLQLNPREVPSPLIGKPVPDFELPPVKGRTSGLASRDLRGEVTLVNVFASWCVPCRDEHGMLMELHNQRVVMIHGLNYKDKPDDVARWLAELGNPFTRTGADLDGRVSIDWGVYGVPETFLIGADGRIVYKHIGPLTPHVVSEKLVPLIQKLRQ